MTFHDLKDIVMIYSSDQNGKPDYTWDKAKIKVWNPLEQKEMKLIFTGSSRAEKPEDYEIHFNASYQEGNTCIDAFENTLRAIFPGIEDSTMQEYKKIFLQEINYLKR